MSPLVSACGGRDCDDAGRFAALVRPPLRILRGRAERLRRHHPGGRAAPVAMATGHRSADGYRPRLPTSLSPLRWSLRKLEPRLSCWLSSQSASNSSFVMTCLSSPYVALPTRRVRQNSLAPNG